MTHNLQVLGYGYFASHQVGAGWPTPAGELLTGGSPRYNIYPTADGRHIACAALEDKFWTRLLELIGLPEEFRDDGGNERSVIEALRARFSSEPAAYWRELLHGEDVCTVLVATHEEAVEAGLIDCSAPDLVAHQENSVSTLPSPVAPALRRPPMTLRYPDLTPLQQAAWPVHQ
jgi:crotonobetainyl-CoA:carnitine CoA-transferase CaiB-like acyl-CoA transferase